MLAFVLTSEALQKNWIATDKLDKNASLLGDAIAVKILVNVTSQVTYFYGQVRNATFLTGNLNENASL